MSGNRGGYSGGGYSYGGGQAGSWQYGRHQGSRAGPREQQPPSGGGSFARGAQGYYSGQYQGQSSSEPQAGGYAAVYGGGAQGRGWQEGGGYGWSQVYTQGDAAAWRFEYGPSSAGFASRNLQQQQQQQYQGLSGGQPLTTNYTTVTGPGFQSQHGQSSFDGGQHQFYSYSYRTEGPPGGEPSASSSTNRRSWRY